MSICALVADINNIKNLPSFSNEKFIGFSVAGLAKTPFGSELDGYWFHAVCFFHGFLCDNFYVHTTLPQKLRVRANEKTPFQKKMNRCRKFFVVVLYMTDNTLHKLIFGWRWVSTKITFSRDKQFLFQFYIFESKIE